jgi:hypothetical protein
MATPNLPPQEHRPRSVTSRQESDIERAVAIATTRLRGRGVDVTGSESSQQLVRLLTAVEEFERAVERRGGDTFINTRGSSQPENPEWVLPARAADESIDAYIRHVERATEQIDGDLA